jgi:hypothetical protein
MFVALTCTPDCVLLAFQICVIVCDELPKSQPTFPARERVAEVRDIDLGAETAAPLTGDRVLG